MYDEKGLAVIGIVIFTHSKFLFIFNISGTLKFSKYKTYYLLPHLHRIFYRKTEIALHKRVGAKNLVHHNKCSEYFNQKINK